MFPPPPDYKAAGAAAIRGRVGASICALNRGNRVTEQVKWDARMTDPIETSMDHQDRLTNLEQWRDLALAHPWPVGLALLSVCGC